MATVASLQIRIGANWSEAERAFREVGAAVKPFASSLQSVGASLTKYVTVPVLALGAASLKASISFESAFAGVLKTVDDATDEFGNLTAAGSALEQGIRQLSTEIPVAAGEIARVVALGGQLGIATGNLLEFAETMIGLAEASEDLSADEAALSLAQFMNITQMSQGDVDRLASTIVLLGNDMATTEGRIVDLAMRIATVGTNVGLTETQILGFAAAIASLGIPAERGGTAISKLMIEIASQVATTGDKLDLFARVAGMSASQFQQAWQTDAGGAIVAFLTGLGRMQEAGGNTLAVMEALGITEVRLRETVLALAGAGDTLTKGMGLANQGWTENIALQEEVARRYGTTESQLRILWNRLVETARTIGDALVPVLMKMLDALEPVFRWVEETAKAFGNLNPRLQEVIVGFLAFAAALGPILFGLGSFLAILPHAAAGLAMFKITSLAAVGALGIIAVAALGLIAVLADLVINWETRSRQFTSLFFDLRAKVIGVMADIVGAMANWLSFIPGVGSALSDLWANMKADANEAKQAAEDAIAPIAALAVIAKPENLKDIVGSWQGLEGAEEALGVGAPKENLLEKFLSDLGLGDTDFNLEKDRLSSHFETLADFLKARREQLRADLAGDLMDPGRLGALPESEIAPGAGLDFLRIGDVSMQVGGKTVSGQLRGISQATHAEMARLKEQFAADFAALFVVADAWAQGIEELMRGVIASMTTGFEVFFATGSITAGFKAFFAGVLGALGDFLIKMGTAAIMAGTIGKAIRSALINPQMSIAAGLAAIALGAALKAASKSITAVGSRGGGGGGRGGSFYPSREGLVNMNAASLAGGTDMGGGAAGLVEIVPRILPSGDQIYAVQEGNRRLSRRGQMMV